LRATPTRCILPSSVAFVSRTASSLRLEWNYVPTFGHLDEPFEISLGIVIPPGSYRWTRHRVEVNTSTKRHTLRF